MSDAALMQQRTDEFRKAYGRVHREISKVIVGHTDIVHGILTCLFVGGRSEEHTSELQSRLHPVFRLLLGKKQRASSVVPGVELRLLRMRFARRARLPNRRSASPRELTNAP